MGYIKDDTLKEMMQIVNENGIEGMLEVFRVLLNEAMLCDRSQALGANAAIRVKGMPMDLNPKQFKRA